MAPEKLQIYAEEYGIDNAGSMTKQEVICATLKKVIEKSIKNYAIDVKLRKFPSNKNVYK